MQAQNITQQDMLMQNLENLQQKSFMFENQVKQIVDNKSVKMSDSQLGLPELSNF